jgi:predicted TIM-barrel fold metal-dependent hydrolase
VTNMLEEWSTVDLENAPLVVVSADTHIGPGPDLLRPYCPATYLDAYDAYVKEVDGGIEQRREGLRRVYRLPGYESGIPAAEARVERSRRNLLTAGHYDMNARLADMDRDGVAAEIIFHGSSNDATLPFMYGPSSLTHRPTGSSHEMELLAVGFEMYNRWLADACSIQPERHVGLAQLPMWDPEAARVEAERARKSGLKAVNFPAPRPGIPAYDDPEWEAFWSTCEDLEMVLATHGGAGDPSSWKGRHAAFIMRIEASFSACRAGLPRLIFSGVFDRHPRLKLTYTELVEHPSSWWRSTEREYDELFAENGWEIEGILSQKPSQYMRQNVFLGASFLHRDPHEAALAVEHGYSDNIMWASDYPHIEGTLVHPLGPDDVQSTTRLALAFNFAGIDSSRVRAMAGENAVRVYGLDRAALAKAAARIEAPTVKDISSPPAWVPEHWGPGRPQ